MAELPVFSDDQKQHLKSLIPPDFTSVPFYADEQIGLYKMIGYDAIELGLSPEDFEAGHDSRQEIIAQMNAYHQNAVEARDRSERQALRKQELKPFTDQLDAVGATYHLEFYDHQILDEDEIGDDKPTPKTGMDLPRLVLDGPVNVPKGAPLTNATGVEIVNDHFVMTEGKKS